MVKTRLSLFSLLILLALYNLTAYAQEPKKPFVSVERQDTHFQVSASITIPVMPCDVYRLLTDYTSLPDYIPGILEIQTERISNSTIKVRQVGEVEFLFLHIKMMSLLEMEEIPGQRIVFKQIEGDLESYSGEWNLQETPEGTKLDYNASLVFKHFIPFFLAKTMLEKEVGRRFEAVYKEALLRNNKNLSKCSAR